MVKRQLTVGDIVGFVEAFAPKELAEPWDNAGLQAGRRAWKVGGILVALDVTKEVVWEAAERGCDMIVAHHPILFHGAKSLCEDEPDGMLAASLIRHGIALYTSHTALDKAEGGVNEELAARIGLRDITITEERFLRFGTWDGGNCGTLLAHVRVALNNPGAVLYGNPASRARSVALCSGSGMSYLRAAGAANVYITGDVTHHDALDALAAGVAVIDVGHRCGEFTAVDVLMRGLQKALRGVECSVQVCASVTDPYMLAVDTVANSDGGRFGAAAGEEHQGRRPNGQT